MNKIKILIARNFTVEPLIDEIQDKLKKKNIKAQFMFSGYEDSVSEFLNKKSVFYKFNPDLVLVFYVLDTFLGSKKRSANIKNLIKKSVLNNINTIVSKVKENTQSNIGIFSLVDPIEIENKKFKDLKLSINKSLKKICNKNKLCNFLNYENEVSKNEKIVFNKKHWKSSLYPFEYTRALDISNFIFKFISTLNGKNHKLIILDADNTLWSGILGEDGINYIKVGNSGKGKYFKSFQKKLKKLKNRGIVLSMCSKNNINDIVNVFKSRSKDMPLKFKDFTKVKANWKQKSENIKLILNELNLSEDNALFVDDSEFEIGQVKNFFPNLDTLLVPKDIKKFERLFEKVGNFENFSITKEDRKRTKLYQDEEKRKTEITKFKNPDDYIKSLNINILIKNNNKKNIKRLSQMTLKTNQFNTTTLRLNESKIEKLIDNKNYLVSECSAEDKFGDYGIIGLAIIKINESNKKAIVENTLFSCRALGRMIEEHFFQKIFNDLKLKKIKTIEFPFTISNKNKPALNFFNDHSFKKLKKNNQEFVFIAEMNKIKLINKNNIVKYI
tara:strand:+ start:3301 stop:4968 length:1668 start_codon:yes stop_codon:yes gene_type:complete